MTTYEQCDIDTIERRLAHGLPLTHEQSCWLFSVAACYEIVQHKRCRRCDGTGKLEWDRCDSCEGSGYQCICNYYLKGIKTNGPFRADCKVHGHLVK